MSGNRVGGPTEYKTVPAFVKTVEEDQGVVDHLISVYGILDLGQDMSHKGMFSKTIQERGDQIRVIDNHRQTSVNDVLGKPVKLWEVGAGELPPEVKAKYPEATGGLMARTKFLLDTPEGKGAFARIKAGAVNQFSFAYDALDYDYEDLDKKSRVRHLRTVRLWEYGPVIFGMNPAAVSVSAKKLEVKNPWSIFKEDGEYCVYKVDSEGDKTGKALGCHESRSEARDQIEALHANVDEASYPRVTDVKEKTFCVELARGKEFEEGSFRTITAKSEGSRVQVTLCEPSGTVLSALFPSEVWTEEKALSLSKLVSEAISSFYRTTFEEGTYYHVEDVFEGYLIVSPYDSLTYYQVGYSTTDEGKFEFVPKDQWIAGTYEFVPEQAGDDSEEKSEPDYERLKALVDIESEELDLEILLNADEAGPAS